MLSFDQRTMPALSAYWLSYKQYIEASLFGMLFAMLFIFSHQIAERKEFGRLSFGRIILLKSVVYLIGLTIIFFIIYGIMTGLNFYTEDAIAMFKLTPSAMLFIFSYLLILILQVVLLNFIIQADKTFGHSKLLNFLTGKYHKPVLEDRVFLFIDLKDSTSYAEQLGNINYSKLIKDCFADLNTLVTQHKAEIYQYVGDEVVITWPTPQTINPPYCINMYFAFKELLEHRSAYYNNKYGLQPQFKAGVNGGKVTATEIGDIKRDIAYHGDVLNTASRIQEACNQYQQSFMITDNLLNLLSGLERYEMTFIGQIQLKGKHDETSVYGIKKLNE